MEDFDKYFGERAGNAYCRFCLNSINMDSAVLLFAIQNNIKEHKKLLPNTIFDIHLSNDLSPIICKICHEDLSNAVKFVDMVSKNEQKLQQMCEIFKTQTIKQEPGVEQIEEIKVEPNIDVDYDKFVRIDIKENLTDYLISETEVTKSKKFMCDICSERFKTKAAITIHMQTHKDKIIDITKYLICELCDPFLCFRTFEEMSKHYKNEHETRAYVRCCNSKYFKKSSIIRHEELHMNPLIHACEICGKRYSGKQHVVRHKSSKHGIAPGNFECDFCHRKFSLKRMLKRHINYTHIKNPIKKKYPCSECELSLFSPRSLAYHLQSIHNIGEKPWIMCDQCNFQTRSRQGLLWHIEARHIGIKETECTICGLKVKMIKRHMELQHFSKPQKCTMCDFEAKNKRLMKSHMRVHSDEKSYKCTLCDKAYKGKVSLDDHMSTHTGIQKWSCNYCDRRFNCSSNKIKHEKQVHPLERQAYEKGKKQNK